MSVHIEKISNDNYRYVVELPRSADGSRNRKKKSGFKNKTEAKKAGEALERQYIRGEFENKNNEMLYSDYLDFWIDTIQKRGKVKETTIANYKKQINNHLKPKLGNYTLKALNHIILQEFLFSLSSYGYAESTVSNIKGTLSKSLKYAYNSLHFIDTNPAAGLEVPVKNTRTKQKTISNQQKNQVISPESISKLLERFPEGNPDHIPILLGYKCGCRAGEAYAVTWNDIDFENATLNINKQLQYDQNNKFWYFTPPKYNSCRLIGIDKNLIEVLVKEKERQEEWKSKHKFYTEPLVDEFGIINYENGKPANFIIRKPNGSFIPPNARMHIGRVAHLELNIPYTYHSLRHTHATMLAEAGFDPLYTKERLGHKNYEVTMKYYIHPTEQTRINGQAKLENLFEQKNKA
ncbi:MAG: tyrosine-type recombinase/integrase [Eubacterium sp.]